MMRTMTCWAVLSFILGVFLLQAAYAQEPADEKRPATAQAIPFKRQPNIDTGSVYHVAWMTLLAAGVAVGSAFLIKKYLQQRGLIHIAKDSRINVLDTKRVSPKLTVFLISIDGMNYVVLQSADRTTITRHKDPPMGSSIKSATPVS